MRTEWRKSKIKRKIIEKGGKAVSIEEVIADALKLVTPDEEERERGKRAERTLRSRLDKVLEGTDISYEFVGSYARDTWLRGSLEIDVFLLFPLSYPTEELEKKGLEIGIEVVDEHELRYAAHPYVHGKVEGVEVDVVPCYRIGDASEIRTAVDRTPLHHRWLKDRIKGKENDVRLLKGFLKAGGIYGAEYRVKGFSGYLCELLIVFYGSFLETVRAGRNLRRDTVIDVKAGKSYRQRGNEKLLVIDPVDERRNVAANLSVDNLARFVQRCRAFLTSPSIDFFRCVDAEVSLQEIERELERRYVYCLKTARPDIVEDNLYTQLERGERKVFEHLQRLGFSPLRSASFADEENCYILVEVAVRELSPVTRRMGPVFEDEKNVERFLRKCRSRNQNPFIEDGRFWVYAERDVRLAGEAIKRFAGREWRAFGKNLGECVKNGFEVLEGKSVTECRNAFELAKFLGLISDTGV